MPDVVDVQEVLARECFRPISNGPVRLGDVSVYRDQSGEIAHTGIVSRVDSVGQVPVVFVWSKWGALEECEHHAAATPYADCTIEYWRLSD
jgi:hypothetical protein